MDFVHKFATLVAHACCSGSSKIGAKHARMGDEGLANLIHGIVQTTVMQGKGFAQP